MIYTLKKKRAFTLDTQDQRMVLLPEGYRIKIEDANVYIEGDEGGWELTIDMVTNFLMKDLEEE